MILFFFRQQQNYARSITRGVTVCGMRSEKRISEDSSKYSIIYYLSCPFDRQKGATHIWERGTSLPSNFQVMCGVGVPNAIHFSETSGPGFNKWPMNLYLSVGLEAVTENKKKKKIVKTYVYCIYVRIHMYIFTTVVRRLLLLRVYSSYVIVSAITRTPRQWLIARTYERDIDLAKEQKKKHVHTYANNHAVVDAILYDSTRWPRCKICSVTTCGDRSTAKRILRLKKKEVPRRLEL